VALEHGSQLLAKESLAGAQLCLNELEEALRAADGGEVTEKYFRSRWELASAEAKYHVETAAYHTELKRKYRRTVWQFWERVAPDPPAPRDPLLARESQLHPAEAHGERGRALAFSPDGKILAIGCSNHMLKLLEFHSGKPTMILSWPENEAYSHSLGFSPDGLTLAGAGDGNTLTVWGVSTGRVIWSLPSQAIKDARDAFSITTAAFSPDGTKLAVSGMRDSLNQPGTRLGAVRLIEARNGDLNWEYPTPEDSGHSIGFAPNGDLALSDTGVAVLLDARTGRVKRSYRPGFSRVISVTVSPDGRILAGGGSDVVNVTGGASGYNASGRVTLWNTQTGEQIRAFHGPAYRADRIAFSPDGKSIACGGLGPMRKGRRPYDNSQFTWSMSEVVMWNVATGDLVWTAIGDLGGVHSMAFSPDGKSLVFCDNEHVEARDAKTGKIQRVFMETVYRVSSDDLVVARDGQDPAQR
jgi:WD40 repeat protein